ncbi:PP2C family serine/threonine-protein phosphatase [Euzebya sp.]|uniref:PP2C family protein-serine/threonine phosphatase n=1 Tax=Euzebya sp. TaxID=1971409 RepID=UPI003517DDA1
MHAILRGVDHTELGRTGVTSPAPGLGLALTRGRHLKRYSYTDPNEDVVATCRADGRTALVVADGHSGHTASHAAVASLLDAMADGVPVWDRRAAVLAYHAVNTAIERARAAEGPPCHRSRTTLTTAVVAEAAGGGDGSARTLTVASVGDSAAFVIRGRVVHRIGRDRHHFLGEHLSAPQVAGALDYDHVALESGDVVVVVSDGFTNFADPAVLADAVDADPVQTAGRIVEAAGDGGAGDNVAVAVLQPAAPAPARPPPPRSS